jgi:signal peptidase II
MVSPQSRFLSTLCLLTLVLGLFGCDHVTKMAAKVTLEGASAVPVAPSVLRGAVELRYVENDDIAFSALRMVGVPRSPTVLIGLGAVALVAILLMMVRVMKQRRPDTPEIDAGDRARKVGLAFVLAGALGNLVDRLARGYVVDFIHVKGWPVFNVADIAVVVGVMLMALPSLLRRTARPPGA